MKSVDIDSVNPSVDDYRSHQVKIEFTGGIQQGKIQGKTQTVTVAYNSLSKRMQTIRRLGGKIVNVSILHFQADISRDAAEHVDANPASATNENISAITESIEQPVEVSVEIPLAEAPVPIVEDTSVIEPDLDQTDHHHNDVTVDNLESNLDLTPQDIAVIAPKAIATVSDVTPEEPIEIIVETENVLEETVEIANVPETVIEAVAEEPVEIASAKVDISSENALAIEALPVVTPKKSKSSLVTSKTKKSRTSAKHGFNKREANPQTHEPITNIVDEKHDENHHVFHQALKTNPEQLSVPIAEIIDEQSLEYGSTNVAEIIPEQVADPILEVEVEISDLAAEASEPIADLVVADHEPVVEPQTQQVEEVNPDLNLEPIINDVVTAVAEKIIEEIPAIATEQISVSIPQVEVIAASDKSKKSKTAGKSGHGFSKPKSRK